MKTNLLYDYPLRGIMFEHVARILIRRKNSNNFIFCCKSFDTIDEITAKYRLDSLGIKPVIEHLRKTGLKTDLVEFELDNVDDRIIKKINFYDVKSKLKNAAREHYDICATSFNFLKDIESINCGAFIIQIEIDRNWNFDFDVSLVKNTRLRVYNSEKKKTLLYLN